MRFKRIWESQVAAKTSSVGNWTWLQSSHLFWDPQAGWLRRQRPVPGSPGVEADATSHHRCPKTCGVWSAQLLQEDNTHIKLTLRGTVKGSKQPPILLVVS